MADYCEDGCCELVQGFEGTYAVCSDCGDDQHQHGVPCSFCGSEQLPPTAMQEREGAQQLEEHARKAIAEAQHDPKTQMYFQRLDSGRLVTTQKEYDYTQEHRIPLAMISYNRATDIMAKQEAAVRQKRKKRAITKAARKAKHGR